MFVEELELKSKSVLVQKVSEVYTLYFIACMSHEL